MSLGVVCVAPWQLFIDWFHDLGGHYSFDSGKVTGTGWPRRSPQVSIFKNAMVNESTL